MREREFRRVGITGLGVISPVGLNVPSFWRAIVEGRSGIDYLPEEIGHPSVKIGAMVKGFDGGTYLDRRYLSRIHPAQQFAYAAGIEALDDAGFLSSDRTIQNVDPEMLASVIGSGIAGGSYIARMQDTIRDKGIGRLSPFDLLQIIPCRVNTVLAMKQRIYGPAFTINAACASSGVSIIEGARMIMVGDADVVIVGGSEAIVNQIGIGAFAAMKALSTRGGDPKEACRPFDEEADGFVLGEGAGILILESIEHAKTRGAEDKIRAELIGYKHCSDSCREEEPQDLRELGLPENHRRSGDTEPSVAGAIACMRGALKMAGLSPESVDHLSAHGPGTVMGGMVELLAIRRVFGDYRVPISSIKATIGHMIAGVAAEVIACVKTIEEDTIPPTLNLHDPIRSDVDIVALKARQQRTDIVMKNMFGFGGSNVSLIVQDYKAA